MDKLNSTDTTRGHVDSCLAHLTEIYNCSAPLSLKRRNINSKTPMKKAKPWDNNKLKRLEAEVNKKQNFSEKTQMGKAGNAIF